MKESTTTSIIPGLLEAHEAEILSDWSKLLAASGGTGGGRIKEGELQQQCRAFLGALRQAVSGGDFANVGTADYDRVRSMLDEISRSRASQGLTPRETVTFVFSLKQPLHERLRTQLGKDGEAIANETWAVTVLLDELGLYTMEAYQKSRDAVIIRQQQEIAELSTPVVKMWDGIVALPLIGALDSARTQVVMENLLQTIVEQSAEIAIIDITGVPTVDTLVAQHLLKTVAAARLMGADCIISGIRPQIAQTMVHLGVELNVVSKATLAGAFAVALQRTGRAVVSQKAVAAKA